MVLRPHVLKYKGKFRKVDSATVQKIQNLSSHPGVKEISKNNLMNKGNTWITFCAIFFFSFPLLYYQGVKSRSRDYVQESQLTQFRLKEIFVLIEENKQSEIGLGESLQSVDWQKRWIEGAIHNILCQKTYKIFMKSDLAQQSAKVLIKQEEKKGKVSLSNANKAKQLSQRQKRNSNSKDSQIDILHKDQKNLYEVCFDLVLSILLSLCENEEGEANYEISSIILQTFVRHIRMHIAQSNQTFNCLQNSLAFQRILMSSKHMISIAKDKEVLNFIFGMLPSMFKEEAKEMNSHLLKSSHPDFNLNSLVIGQGFQGIQGYNQMNQGQGQGGGGLNSAKSSAANQHNQSPMQINSKNEEEKRTNNHKDSFFKKRLSFNKATSEPPSANKNAVMPVEEDSNDEDFDYDKGGEVVETAMMNNKGASGVPPILMSQIQNQPQIINSQNQSNSVMNNYFNMPLGSFNTTIGQNNSRGFKMVAKSRLTRRQMSMSRKQTQKLPSVSNFPHLNYGEDTSKTRDFRQDFNSQERQEDNTNKSTSQNRKGPFVPKLNINSIVADSTPMHKMEHLGLHTTSHAQITQNKSSNRSNKISAKSGINFENQIVVAQSRMSKNGLANYQTNANFIKQGDSEDHNISMYDEVNGSFIDEIGDGQNNYIYDNAEEKLCQLAIQLGESCLTNDLAALISQKRDIELVKSARKVAHKNPKKINISRSKTQTVKGMQRSISVSYKAENIFKRKDSMDQNFSSMLGPLTDHQQVQQDQGTLSIQRTRLVLLNIAHELLKRYDIDEARFLKHPIQAFNAYLGSDKFKTKRQQLQIATLEIDPSLEANKVSQKVEKSIITLSGEVIPLSQAQDMKSRTPLLNPNELQQITEANQSDMEEVKDSEKGTNEQYIEDSVFSIQNQDDSQIQKLSSSDKLKSLVSSINYFQSYIQNEEKIIFKIYQKFTFVNEDILRKQVMNELANFAAKDKSVDVKLFNTLTSAKLHDNNSFAQGLFLVNNLMTQGGSNIPPPLSSTPIKGMNYQGNLSFDEPDDDFYYRRERSTDVIQTLGNPNTMWMNNGIAYELNSSTSSKSTAATMVAKERMRKKLDVLLYNADRRIKCLIQQYYERSTQTFAEDLNREISTINEYLMQQSSRIMLYQVIEVNLEALLMIKKCLIDIALKTSKFLYLIYIDIFVMDFSKQIGHADAVFSGGIKIRTPSNNPSLSYQTNALLIENQKKYRDLFSEYLRLVSILLNMPQTSETMKLLNETLVFDDQWLDAIKTYSISLFLSDIISTISINDRNNTQSVSLVIEELRGVNLINFIEPDFMSQVISTNNSELCTQVRQSIYHLLLCSLNIMRYYKSVLKFFHNSIQKYFPQFMSNKKSKYPASGGADGATHMKDTKMEQKPDYNSAQKDFGIEDSDLGQMKYWKHIIRKVMYQYMYLITPPNGLFAQYLLTNAINHVNSNSAQQNNFKLGNSPSRRFERMQSDRIQEDSTYFRSGQTPLNFKLTKSVLSFTHQMFNFPDKFTRYVFIDELMLFYIRTHYISFVRLYNKNFNKKEELTSQNKDASLSLCKKHLRCLFTIAKNRNEDTRRKLYQFKLVQFLTQEVELEFDIQQRRKRFIELSKEEKERLVQDEKQQNQEQTQVNEQQTQQKTGLPTKFQALGLTKLNLSGVAGPSLFSGVDANLQDVKNVMEEQKNAQNKVQDPPKKGLPMNLKLNIQGLGLSDLVQDEPKIQSSQNNDVQNNLIGNPAQNQKPQFKIPALKIAGLGLSELTQDNSQQIQNIQQQMPVQQQENQAASKEQPKKVGGLGFKIPALKIQGLGLSDLIPDNSQPQPQTQQLQIQQQIQQADPNSQNTQVKAPPFKPPALNIQGLGLSDLVPDAPSQIVQQEEIPPPPPVQAIKKVPMLKIQGLGLSDLVPDNSVPQNQPQILESQPQENQNQNQSQQPELLNKKPTFKVPGLNITGLGMTGLINDDQQVNQNIPPPQNPPKKLGFAMPKLNITGLCLSDLVPDTQMSQPQPKQQDLDTINPDSNVNKTIDYGNMQEELFKKNEGPFDKTAPLKMYQEDNEKSENKRFNTENLTQAKQLKSPMGMIINMPEEELKEGQKALLQKGRIKILNQKVRTSQSQSRRTNSELDDNSFFEKRDKTQPRGGVIAQNADDGQMRQSQLSIINQGMRIESIIDANSNQNSPKAVVSRDILIRSEQKPNKNMMISTQNMPNERLDVEQRNQVQSLFVPSNFVQTPNEHSSRSKSSNGSFVGKNKVFVPFINFPSDLGEDKIKIYEKPDDNRFKLIKTNQQATPEIQRNHQSSASGTNVGEEQKNASSLSLSKQKGGFGKKGKLLDIGSNSSQKNDSVNSQDVKQKKAFNFGMGKDEEQKGTIVPNIPKPEKREESKNDGKDNVENQKEKAKSTQQILQKIEDPKSQEHSNQMTQLKVASQIKLMENNQNQATLTQEDFYLKERNQRPIYQDEELHVLMLSLITCLLLKPERGILDELYCSQYPIMNGKQNILYLLHHHFNHSENFSVIEKVLSKVQEINPPLAGQRLLKLLCGSLFDISLYNNGKNWRKIAEGAYAKVYEAETNLSEPQTVAVKQMLLPSSIYERCTLHDIFTEITCLEELRLEPCVTDLYDYGVDHECYYIVQKRYACSLRDWRLEQSKQKKSLNENLSIYLSIYKEFLKSMQTIHAHNVTHYDIKCDNVLIDSNNTGSTNNLSKAIQSIDEDRLKLALADFGECKIFSDEKDELCQRNRGTEYCRPPEMLQLNYNTRKDLDKYDRRKQVGTNRLADIWSAGCLFYEILTGEILFFDPVYSAFLQRVTKHTEPLFTPERLDLINNNIYLIDFLKYILVRDPRLRPSIDNVVKRFEHVHALLVSTTAQASNLNRFSLLGLQPNGQGNRGGQSTLDSMLDQAQAIMMQNSEVYGGEIKEENNNNGEALGKRKSQKVSQMDEKGAYYMQIMHDVYFSSDKWLKCNQLKAVKMGITHVIIEEQSSSQTIKDKFDVLEISESEQLNTEVNPFIMMTYIGVMDFMRKVAIQKGRVIYVENASKKGESKQKNGIKQRMIRECLLICLNHIFQINAYETYMLIRSQNLFFKIASQRLGTLSKWSQITSKINQYMQTFPRFQCICGSCVIILKRQFANYQSLQTINCNCRQYYKSMETSQCPSSGCFEFIQYLKTYFKSIYNNSQTGVQIESLQWGFLEEEDFVLGPNHLGSAHQNSIQNRMIIGNMSQTIDKNSTVVSIIEKKNQASNIRGGGMKDHIDFNMISKSSATMKNYGYCRWKLFKCKECHVWTHAVNELENKYALLLNNRVKDTQSSGGLQSLNSRPTQVNIGSLNEKQAGNEGVRVPILSKIKLSLPF